MSSLVTRSFEDDRATGVIATQSLVPGTDLAPMAVQAFGLLESDGAPAAPEIVVCFIANVFVDSGGTSTTIHERDCRQG